MNFKITFLALSIIASAHAITDASELSLQEPIPGIAIFGKISFLNNSNTQVLCLYDAKGKLLWIGDCTSVSKNPENIQAICPTCVDTTQLTHMMLTSPHVIAWADEIYYLKWRNKLSIDRYFLYN